MNTINISDKPSLSLYHISDLHGTHDSLEIPYDIEVMAITGDATNYRNSTMNMSEYTRFLDWFAAIPVSYKIYVPGNHDSYIYENLNRCKKEMLSRGITLLHQDSIQISDLKIYGDGTTPQYGDWCFMKKRETISKTWENIPEDTDILLTHGPPKGILDLTTDRHRNLERAGCGALGKRILKLNNLKLNCFGHIHNTPNIKNTGVLYREGVYYSNASAVVDGEFTKGIQFNGTIFNI